MFEAMVWELNILPTGVDKAYAIDNGPQWRWKDRASWGVNAGIEGGEQVGSGERERTPAVSQSRMGKMSDGADLNDAQMMAKNWYLQ